jgi:uncharacterized membrane protein
MSVDESTRSGARREAGLRAGRRRRTRSDERAQERNGIDVVWAGAITGIGVAGTLDEVVLHQLLGWHHFYDRSTTTIGLVSDGLFHLFSTVMLAVGLWLLLRRRDWTANAPRRALSGGLIGAGGFNLYDGTIQHKVLRLHEVRADAADSLPYDLAFLGVAVVVLVSGIVLLRSSSRP